MNTPWAVRGTWRSLPVSRLPLLLPSAGCYRAVHKVCSKPEMPERETRPRPAALTLTVSLGRSPRLVRVAIVLSLCLLLFFLSPVHKKEIAWIAIVFSVLVMLSATPNDVSRSFPCHLSGPLSVGERAIVRTIPHGGVPIGREGHPSPIAAHDQFRRNRDPAVGCAHVRIRAAEPSPDPSPLPTSTLWVCTPGEARSGPVGDSGRVSQGGRWR